MMYNVGREALDMIICIGMLLAWVKGQVDLEDRDIIEAHEYVQEKLRDGDFVSKVELHTGRNLRDQLSIEELKDIQEHIDLLKMGPRRN